LAAHAHSDGTANAHTHRRTHRQTKPPPKPRPSGRSRLSLRLIRRKRGAHVGLVGGVGARPVREVGDKDEEGGGRVVVVGVEEDSCGQALAPRDGGAEVAVGVVADLVEAIAPHEVGVGLDGVAVGEVDRAVDVGSEEGGGGVDDGATTTTAAAAAADGEAQALLQCVARAAVDALERALEERGPGVIPLFADYYTSY
jgi:hypothetical protein